MNTNLFLPNYNSPKPFELHEESVDASSMSLEEACQHLWDLDSNRLIPEKDYDINVQRGKKPYHKEDSARDPLFASVDNTIFQRPTYKTFVALLDNYSAECGEAENLSNAERMEISAFLSAILQTAPMQFCHKYCHAKNPSGVPASLGEFRKLLFKIWFELYNRSRGGRADSSGFEHVFTGEIKVRKTNKRSWGLTSCYFHGSLPNRNQCFAHICFRFRTIQDNKISGFHNWIQFYLEEKRGKVDYKGYLKPRSNRDAQVRKTYVFRII